MLESPSSENDRFSAFVFKTRGLYMFIALAISIVIKYYLGGTTPLLLFITSLVIMAIVQAFRVYSASVLWGKQAVAKVRADFLCTDGPYAHMRNPLYLGNLFIGIGLCIAINEWYAYVSFIISYILVYYTVIPYEERFMRGKFGNDYADYKANTGRLIPRVDGYKGHSRVIPDYKAGILGEIHVPIILAIISLSIYVLFVRS